MDPRQREINSLEREVRELEDQLQGECVDIGTRLQGLPPESLARESLVKYVRNMEALVRSQEELNAQIERIHRLVRDIAQRRGEIDSLKTGHAALVLEYDKIAFDVGAAAYSRFKSLPDPAPYRAHFEEILKVDEEIDRLEKELKAVEEEDKTRGFFGRLVSRGRSIGVRSSINKQGKIKLEKFASAGKSVAASDFASRADLPPELRALFDQIAQRRRAADQAREEIARREEEVERLRSELRVLGAAEDADGQVRSIEQRVADTNKELALVRLWAGQAFVQDDAHDRIADPMLKGKATLAMSLHGVIADKRRRIAQLKARIELESLEAKVRSLQKKREQLEAEIRLRDEQIRSVQEEVGRVQQRMDDLRKTL
jgi:predicted  nucleic acid-binding Zn-ribbon protein